MSYLGWVPWTTNTTPGGFDEQRFQKGGLKGALVVVDGGSFVQGQQSLVGLETLYRRRSHVVAVGLVTIVTFVPPLRDNIILDNH